MALPKQKKIEKKNQQNMKYDHAHVILYPTLKHYNRLNYFFFFIVVPIQVYQLNYLICEYGVGKTGHMKAAATHNNKKKTFIQKVKILPFST